MESNKVITLKQTVAVPNHYVLWAHKIVEHFFKGQNVVFQYVDRDGIPDLYRFTTVKDQEKGYPALERPTWFADTEYWDEIQPHSFCIVFYEMPTAEDPGIPAAGIKFPRYDTDYKIEFYPQ